MRMEEIVAAYIALYALMAYIIGSAGIANVSVPSPPQLPSDPSALDYLGYAKDLVGFLFSIIAYPITLPATISDTVSATILSLLSVGYFFALAYVTIKVLLWFVPFLGGGSG